MPKSFLDALQQWQITLHQESSQTRSRSRIGSSYGSILQPTHILTIVFNDSGSFARDRMTAFNIDILPTDLTSAITYQDLAAGEILFYQNDPAVQPGGAGMVVLLYNKANDRTFAYYATYDVVVALRKGMTKFEPSELKKPCDRIKIIGGQGAALSVQERGNPNGQPLLFAYTVVLPSHSQQ